MNGLAACAGTGALEAGLRFALGGAYRTICYIEREAYAAAILAARMADGCLDEAPVWSDLTSFDGRFWRGTVDLVTAGIPCQPFSCAGKRAGVADERYLWPFLWRVVRDVGAWALFLENVPGIIHNALPLILGDLADRGWSAEWDVFSAAGVGAPHLRKRLFLLAADPERGGVWREHRGRGGSCGQAAAVARDDGAAGAVADAAVCKRAAERRVQQDGLLPALLADAGGEGSQERKGERRDAGAEQQAAERGGWWATEPAVGRVADGVAYRVDRLRAIGNGVVPLVAATAWSVLSKRLEAR